MGKVTFKPVMVGYNGIKVKVQGRLLRFWDDDFIFNFQGRKVYCNVGRDMVMVCIGGRVIRKFSVNSGIPMAVYIDNGKLLDPDSFEGSIKTIMESMREWRKAKNEFRGF